MASLRDAVIVDAVRTPIGKYGGVLSSIRPDDLAAHAIRKLLDRVGIEPTQIEDVYLGCGNQAGEDNRNVARMAVLIAGLPPTIPGVTVNRLCASGLDAVNNAVRAVSVGDGDIFIAGGVESMSRAPLVMPKAETAFPRGGTRIYDTTIGWRFVNPRLQEKYQTLSMGECAEVLAEKYKILREDQDHYALRSHKKAIEATDSGLFEEEIVQLEISKPGGQKKIVKSDEGPRRVTNLEKLAALKPVFKNNGTVTAGNSSQLSDGAAAILVASKEKASELGLKSIARIVSTAVAAVHPDFMGMGPVPATQKALERAGISLDEVDLIEINEAFASQVLACLAEFKIQPDDRINPHGGAIALGHPIGCSGARIMTTLVHEMMRRKEAQYGLATLCVGVGQGEATIVEKIV